MWYINVTATEWYHTRSPIHCDHFWSIVRTHLNSNNSWFIHQSSLAVTSRHLVVNEEKHGERCSWILPTKYLYTYLYGSLTWRKILRHRADGFTSPSKEVVLRILSPLNIHRTRPGLNPANLGSNGKHANHYTTEAETCGVLNTTFIYFTMQFLPYDNIGPTKILKYLTLSSFTKRRYNIF
jgi:hypothetical protein